MPTLYDNFERVRQYIDQHQGGGGDMSAYVTKDELSAQSYLTSIPSTYASYNGVYAYLHSMGIDKKSNWGCYIDSAYITDSELSGDIVINGISTWQLPTYAAISEMGYLTSIPSEYVTDTELSSALGNYYTDGEVDAEISSALSFYYTKTEINNASYVTSSDLPVINENIIPKETATYTLGDSSHIYSNTYSRGVYLGTGIRMFSESSASSNDMAISLGGVSYFYLNTNRFAPNGAANNEKLDLGTADRKWNHIYGKSINVDTTYTSNLYSGNIVLSDTYNFITNGSNTQINFAVNQYNRFKMTNAAFAPSSNNSVNLGTSSEFFKNAYSTNIYTENVSYTSGKSSIKLNDRNVDIWANNKKMVNVSDYNGVVPTQTNVNLGGSSNKWAATYTSDLYADTIHNFIWTGTSAEYAALDNYTTYQIYMIKES